MKNIPVRTITAAKEPAIGKFSIRRVQDILNGNDLQHDLHRHSFFFILLIMQGKGSHEIDFKPHEVTAHSIFLLRPGQVHQLYLKAGAKGFLMEFDNEFYRPGNQASLQRLRKASAKNYCQLEANRFQKLHTLLNTIFEECAAKQEGYIEVIRASLEVFYIEFIRQSEDLKSIKTIENTYTQERFEEFNELLEKHVAIKKQVSDYTSLMNLSSYQLNEITKSAIGKTASVLIDEHILLEAKRYLLATSSQVKEIADHLGYEDPSYFIRFFKKHTGHSPDAFRKNFK